MSNQPSSPDDTANDYYPHRLHSTELGNQRTGLLPLGTWYLLLK